MSDENRVGLKTHGAKFSWNFRSKPRSDQLRPWVPMFRRIAKEPRRSIAYPHFAELAMRKIGVVISKLSATARTNVVIRRWIRQRYLINPFLSTRTSEKRLF